MLSAHARLLRRLEAELYAPTPDEERPPSRLVAGAELVRLVAQAADEVPAERWSRAYRSHRVAEGR